MRRENPTEAMKNPVLMAVVVVVVVSVVVVVVVSFVVISVSQKDGKHTHKRGNLKGGKG